MAELFRLRRGDRLTVKSIASVIAQVEADFRVVYDHGGQDLFHVPRFATVANRIEQSHPASKTALANGYVVSGQVTSATTLGRGQCYVQAHVRTGGGADDPIRSTLLGDYLYGLHAAPLGRFVDPGPSGGPGNLFILDIAEDVTPIDISTALGVTGAIRKIHEFAWWYHSSGDVADRTLVASFVEPLGPGPTGFSILATFWLSATLTLSANEEGLMFSKEGYTSYNDNGTLTRDDQTTSPSVLPLLVRGDDSVDFFTDVTLAEAADRHSIRILMEEWLNVIGTGQ